MWVYDSKGGRLDGLRNNSDGLKAVKLVSEWKKSKRVNLHDKAEARGTTFRRFSHFLSNNKHFGILWQPHEQLPKDSNSKEFFLKEIYFAV